MVLKPVCIECGTAIPCLTRSYGKSNVQLVKCKTCGNFADKYLENEFIIIFLDMLLQKPAVYRHLLLNQSMTKDQLKSLTLRLSIILILFEVFARWTHLPSHSFQSYYFYLFTLCLIEFAVFHLYIRSVSFYIYKSNSLNDVTCALILSSFGKLLLLCVSIWDYNDLERSWLLSVMIFMTNNVALAVMLRISRLESVVVLMIGIGVKVMLQFIFKMNDPNLRIVLI